MFARNGVYSSADVKNLRAEARDMLIEDLRDEGFKLIDIQLLMDILHLLPPLISQKTNKLRKFEEVNIPQKMKSWTADLDRLESFIKPDQLMVNAISDQISRAKAVPPPYTPFPTADFVAPPWLPNDAEHVRSQEGWNARQSDVGFRQPQSSHS